MDLDMLDRVCGCCSKNGTSACEYDCPLTKSKPKYEEEIAFWQETETISSITSEQRKQEGFI